MRLPPLSALAPIAAVAFFVGFLQSAPAAARVLLPDDTAAEEAAPNLGLVPASPKVTAEPEKPVYVLKPEAEEAAPKLEGTTLKIIPKTSGQTRSLSPQQTQTAPSRPNMDVSVPEPINQNQTVEEVGAKALEAAKNPEVEAELKKLKATMPTDREIEKALEEGKETAPVQITPGGKVAPASKEEVQQLNLLINTKNGLGAKTQKALPPQVEAIIKARDEEDAARKRRASTILRERKLPVLDSNLFKKSLNVQVGKEYQWGENDLEVVTRALGYDRKAITQHCQLRLDPTLETEKHNPLYTGRIYAGQSGAIKYEGALKSVSLKARAICHKPSSLPQSGSILYETGGNYAVLLMGQPSCAFPADSKATPSALLIAYQGDGTVSCRF